MTSGVNGPGAGGGTWALSVWPSSETGFHAASASSCVVHTTHRVPRGPSDPASSVPGVPRSRPGHRSYARSPSSSCWEATGQAEPGVGRPRERSRDTPRLQPQQGHVALRDPWGGGAIQASPWLCSKEGAGSLDRNLCFNISVCVSVGVCVCRTTVSGASVLGPLSLFSAPLADGPAPSLSGRPCPWAPAGVGSVFEVRCRTLVCRGGAGEAGHAAHHLCNAKRKVATGPRAVGGAERGAPLPRHHHHCDAGERRDTGRGLWSAPAGPGRSARVRQATPRSFPCPLSVPGHTRRT